MDPRVSPAIRFALEDVIHVRILSSKKRDERRDPIRRQEERTPALALTDMNAFVVARHGKRLRIATEHDVTERHGGGAAAKEGTMAEEKGYNTTVNFEYAGDDAHPATAEEGEGDKHEPDERGGESPEIDKRTQQEGHGNMVVARRLGRSGDKLPQARGDVSQATMSSAGEIERSWMPVRKPLIRHREAHHPANNLSTP
jgi:hypothetical protein